MCNSFSTWCQWIYYFSVKAFVVSAFHLSSRENIFFWNCFLEKKVSYSVHYQNLRALFPSLAAVPYTAAWKQFTHVALSFGNKNIWSSSDERSMFEREQSKIISLLTLRDGPNKLDNTSNIQSTLAGTILSTIGHMASKYFSKWEVYANESNEPSLL